MRATSSIFLALALASLFSSSVIASDKTAARDAYRKALQHFNLGEYPDALAGFKEAYRNFDDPSFLFNIAQCERLLNHKQEAIRAYRTYLTNAPNAPNRDEVHALTERLSEELRQERETERSPPQGVLTPTPIASERDKIEPVRVERTASPPARQPVYKRWWFWSAIGAVIVTGAGVGFGVGLSRPGAPSTHFGNMGVF